MAVVTELCDQILTSPPTKELHHHRLHPPPAAKTTNQTKNNYKQTKTKQKRKILQPGFHFDMKTKTHSKAVINTLISDPHLHRPISVKWHFDMKRSGTES